MTSSEGNSLEVRMGSIRPLTSSFFFRDSSQRFVKSYAMNFRHLVAVSEVALSVLRIGRPSSFCTHKLGSSRLVDTHEVTNKLCVVLNERRTLIPETTFSKCPEM
jgi:hypothetical protein